jgi:hypothetical protein
MKRAYEDAKSGFSNSFVIFERIIGEFGEPDVVMAGIKLRSQSSTLAQFGTRPRRPECSIIL